ncbi:DUF992 domain-containing protein [Rhizobium sp. WL3]|uniref:DUF992 domain-containing protein n=1 Tax=Rhizobium sp. WL3 TaxID=2603277 RepID=UPI001FEE6665|nr:DUF992 domain-containing protein [Rhizobium sp. WL3]
MALAADSRKQASATETGKAQRVGTLSCEIEGGVGLLVTSSRAVDCQFRGSDGEVERYTGSIGRLGLDVGVTGKTYMSWIVVNTEASRIGDGALAGSYVGASANAALGVGLGANALIGGNAKNFGLQPLSAQAGTGLNLAAGVTRLQLQKAR